MIAWLAAVGDTSGADLSSAIRLRAWALLAGAGGACVGALLGGISADISSIREALDETHHEPLREAGVIDIVSVAAGMALFALPVFYYKLRDFPARTQRQPT